MPEMLFSWQFEPEQPSTYHCGGCGFQMEVKPSLDEVIRGFTFYCLRCGREVTISGRGTKAVPKGAIAIGASREGYLFVRGDDERVILRSPSGLVSAPLSSVHRWELSQPEPEQPEPEQPKPERASRRCPAVKDLEGIKSVREWLRLLTKTEVDQSLVNRFGTKFKKHYKALYRKEPTKRHQTNCYRGDELDAILKRMASTDDPLLAFLQEWRRPRS